MCLNANNHEADAITDGEADAGGKDMLGSGKCLEGGREDGLVKDAKGAPRALTPKRICDSFGLTNGSAGSTFGRLCSPGVSGASISVGALETVSEDTVGDGDVCAVVDMLDKSCPPR